MNPLRQLALVVNDSKPGSAQLAEELTRIAREQQTEVHSTHHFPLPEGFLRDVDACCVLGGDGTLLGTVAQSLEHDVPVFGVNQGKLGFLATFAADEIIPHFAEILQGAYRVVRRSLLKVETADGQRAHALNDVVIKNSIASRLIQLDVYSGEDFVTPYNCDGLILATPTGSTAYNLSAGGPIIHPEAEVISMTPICPHTLSNRSVIFSHTQPLRFLCSTDCCPQITIDGRQLPTNQEAFPLSVRISRQSLPLLQRQEYSHFRILRNKLNWSGEADSSARG